MACVLGVNGPNDLLQGDDISRIKATGVKHVLELHRFASRWSEYHSAGITVHARYDARGALRTPEQEAATFASFLNTTPYLGGTARYRNEPAVSVEGIGGPDDWALWLGPEAYSTTPWMVWAQWLLRFGRAVKQLTNCAVFAPAMSPGVPGAERWIEATAASAEAAGFDGMDGHVYGSPEECRQQLILLRSVWPAFRRLMVTEHNFGGGRRYDLNQYAADLPRVLDLCAEFRVEAMFVFIWRWAHPDMYLPTTLDVKGTVVEKAIMSMAKSVAWPVEATPMSLKDQFPAQFMEWEAAGGIENNFRKHLLGIKALPATMADIALLAGEMRADVDQLQNVIASLSK